MSTMEPVTIRQVRDAGLLMEINRQVLHPIGMTMSFNVAKSGAVEFGGFWRDTSDERGIWLPWDEFEAGRIENMARNYAELREPFNFAARREMFAEEHHEATGERRAFGSIQEIPPSSNEKIDYLWGNFE